MGAVPNNYDVGAAICSLYTYAAYDVCIHHKEAAAVVIIQLRMRILMCQDLYMYN